MKVVISSSMICRSMPAFARRGHEPLPLPFCGCLSDSLAFQATAATAIYCPRHITRLTAAALDMP